MSDIRLYIDEDISATLARTLRTYNIRDFRPLASKLALNQQTHFGIVVSTHLPFGELLRRTVNLMRTRTAEDMINRFDWLQN